MKPTQIEMKVNLIITTNNTNFNNFNVERDMSADTVPHSAPHYSISRKY